MALGTGIFLLVLGAILTFALNVHLSGLDLQVVGVILMLAGALGVVLEFALFAPRRRAVRETTIETPATEVSTRRYVSY